MTSALVRALEPRLPAYLGDLESLTSIDCPTGYKPGLDEIATLIAERLTELGAQIEVIQNDPAGNDVMGTIRGRAGQNVLFLCHTDTVYPVGTVATRPYRTEGNRAFSPGICDMKAGLLTAIYACLALKDIEFENYGTIRILCTSDEEGAPRHSVDRIKHVASQSDYVFCMEAARANGDVVSNRKGVVVFRLEAHGREAHAGVNPDLGRNAIVAMADRIGRIWQLNGIFPGVTVSPGLISGGTAVNTVPGYALCSIDVRVQRAADIVAIERELRAILADSIIPEVRFDLSNRHTMPPMEKTDASQRLVDLARQAASEIGFTLNDTATGGGSDGAYAASVGVPVLDGVGPIGGNAHSELEYLEVDSIVPRTAMLARIVTLL